MNEKRILFTEEEIQRRVSEIAQFLNEKFEGRDPIIIGLLTGSFMFCSDLLRQLTFPFQFEFIRTSGYVNSTTVADEIYVEDFAIDVVGRDVIIIDDILDTGKTMKKLRKYFLEKGALSITAVVMFNKEARRETDITADIVGYEVEDVFLVGYGMDDVDSRHRALPYVYALDE